MSLLELLCIAVGLSMDAFAVAVCKGLATSTVKPRHMIIVGLWFGGFQALMPLIGYFVGATFKEYIEAYDHWIALVLLSAIGLNMIRESIWGDDEESSCSFCAGAMLPMAIATSIDALIVGVTFALLPEVNITFKFNAERGASDVYVNGELAEGKIRSIEVSNCVSSVSSIREVREKLVAMQQQMGRERGVVMDGRDIGTVVFPDAELKIFMTAEPKVRAERRYAELTAKGDKVTMEEILENVISRDKADMERAISPLRQAEDAVVLDNSYMSVEEQMAWFMERYEQIVKA